MDRTRRWRRRSWHLAASRSAAAGLAGLILTVGCSAADEATEDDEPASGDAPVGGDDPAEEEPSGWPIDVPPADAEVIDRDLVARILVELDLHLADIHRSVAREGDVGELPQALIRSVYTEEAASSVERRLEDQLEEVREDATTPRSAVIELGAVDQGCVDALVRRDLAPVLDVEDGVGTWQVTLVAVEDSDNGTAWRMALDEPGDDVPAGCA